MEFKPYAGSIEDVQTLRAYLLGVQEFIDKLVDKYGLELGVGG
jgi:hypothetical protein